VRATRLRWVRPSSRTAATTASASNRAWRTSVAPSCAQRTAVPSPPTWKRGRLQSQRSPGRGSRFAAEARARASNARTGSRAALGVPVVPEVKSSAQSASGSEASATGGAALARVQVSSGSAPGRTPIRAASASTRLGRTRSRWARSSSGASRTLSGTSAAPSRRSAKRRTTVAGWLAARTTTRSPGRIPLAPRPPATAATSPSRPAQVQLCSPATRAGPSGSRRACAPTGQPALTIRAPSDRCPAPGHREGGRARGRSRTRPRPTPAGGRWRARAPGPRPEG